MPHDCSGGTNAFFRNLHATHATAFDIDQMDVDSGSRDMVTGYNPPCRHATRTFHPKYIVPLAPL